MKKNLLKLEFINDKTIENEFDNQADLNIDIENSIKSCLDSKSTDLVLKNFESIKVELERTKASLLENSLTRKEMEEINLKLKKENEKTLAKVKALEGQTQILKHDIKEKDKNVQKLKEFLSQSENDKNKANSELLKLKKSEKSAANKLESLLRELNALKMEKANNKLQSLDSSNRESFIAQINKCESKINYFQVKCNKIQKENQLKERLIKSYETKQVKDEIRTMLNEIIRKRYESLVI